MRLITLILLLINTVAISVAQPVDSVPYGEKYRPQYHFTSNRRWVGDPSGLIRHDGRWLAYSWGAAESTDLVHWNELNHNAMVGVPKGISTFTGSVVVDTAGTGGWGRDALVAVFTSFDQATKKQSQSVAFSHDNGATYQYYDLNPVLDIWSTEFRDPTVIRHGDRWSMSVAKALEKKVAFYQSDDLKHWTLTSEFGPMGDNERSWECPDIFQLPVEGTDSLKWVLLVSVNWSREQYFPGEFDGREFTPDHAYSEPLYVDDGLDYYASRVFQNYDEPADSVYTIGWVNWWDYAPAAPTSWGKGIWSIPRTMSLYPTAEGLRLRQLPAPQLEMLRGREWQINRKLRAGVTPLPTVSAMQNMYEIDVVLDCRDNDVAGLNLCCGDGRKVAISYDSSSHYLTVDRTNSTDATIPKFERIAYSKLPVEGSEPVKLRIFVDKSTIEIFAQDGRKVLTLLTYAAPGQDGAELFSQRGQTSIALTAWPLKSIH